MTYKLRFSISAEMLEGAWSGSEVYCLDYDFDENEIKILKKNFSKNHPEDDISETLEICLPGVYESIYDLACGIAKDSTYFEGDVMDILDYLDKEFAIDPVDVIKKDIWNNSFKPRCEKWYQLPVEELKRQWCDFRKKDFDKTKYIELSRFFVAQYHIYVDFIYELTLHLHLPQELYTDIKRKTKKKINP